MIYFLKIVYKYEQISHRPVLSATTQNFYDICITKIDRKYTPLYAEMS